MAAPTKRSRSDDIPNSDNPSLPDDILDYMILPRLPFKTLKRFQCVSNRYRSLIGHDPLFPSEQARLLSPSSTDLVYLARDGRLSFLINPASIGVPDPSLRFLGCKPSNLKLLCSTNGLILFYGSFEDSKHCLCVCNPATQEKVFVPTTQHMRVRDTGLAFDPTIAPNRYILVSPRLEYANDRRAFGFDIFRSDTGEWSRSNKKVHLIHTLNFLKKVHTQGVIYWRSLNYIMWYNTEKDLAGSVSLPIREVHWCMGVCAGGVVCCCSCTSGVEVWRLTNGTQWNRLHCISWHNLQLQLSPTWMKRKMYCRYTNENWLHIAGYFKSLQFQPLAFDGQFIYLLNFPEQGMSSEMLGYNICTQQLEKKGGKIVTKLIEDDGAYDLSNSMVPLPK